jgi:hypothetical protein
MPCREAARRVRERRLNTIKHLSDQVERLQAENAALKQQVDGPAQASSAGPSRDASNNEEQKPIIVVAQPPKPEMADVSV